MKYFISAVFFISFFISCIPKKESIKGKIATNKPNILFISVDDLNDWSGFLKNFPNVKTPNIDNLASKGMAFTNAHCQAPICAPSRASLFSGLYPHTTGLYYQFTDKDLKVENKAIQKTKYLPDYLEDNGYKTLAVGKVFHNGDENGVFQEYGGIFPKMKFGPFFKNRKRQNYNPAWFPKKRGNTVTDWAPMDLPDSTMTDYKIADWAINELDKKHEKPFFMAVGFVRPHVPWYVPKKWFDLFKDDDIKVPPYKANDYDDIPEISKKLHEISAMPDTNWLIKENKWKDMVKSYLACMAFVDAQIGKVLNKLEKSEYKNNTLIVLWSDHGYHLGEKDRTAKHSLWERSTHVPLIFAGKGIKPSTKTNKPVGLIDLYPTILDAAGLPNNIQNEGNTLLPLIKDEKTEWNHAALTSYGYKNVSLFKGDFHFIQYRDGSGELYNLKDDPNEWKNLFLDNQHKTIVNNFKKLVPNKHAPLSKVNMLNVNKHIDEELKEFGAKLIYKDK
ncbi:arylsulfatase A-like enzyme [Lutibacter sp. Hel_I_33_5]|uniref:sulfatase n=1 Tax=Lutibacter sp. Hel_I_33_5 TaxID=1566289 RepID=UPI00119DA2E5|nr:sulfatase [Lutibacter sp. Hel_I_33_5]TVZ55637.1 arylsulfatase A-like enzyme [Lutibacter sp. Hel_I_33_5]